MVGGGLDFAVLIHTFELINLLIKLNYILILANLILIRYLWNPPLPGPSYPYTSQPTQFKIFKPDHSLIKI